MTTEEKKRPGRQPILPPSPLGQRIRDTRESRGMTITQLARKSGLQYGTIRSAERGYNDPSLLTICCIAKVLNVSLDFLVWGERKTK